MAYSERLYRRAAKQVCERCHRRSTSVEIQHSFGIYAGIYCYDCAFYGYRDHCGLDGPGAGGRQGTRDEYEELSGPGTYEE